MMTLRIHILLCCCTFFFLRCASNSPRGGQIPFITIEEELQLGEEIASYSIQNLKIINNRAITHFLSGIAAEIGRVSYWKGLHYTIFIVNESDINHFSLPGGNIFLFRGLLEMCSSSEEIAAVIAHEIAHLAQRDGTNRLAEKYGFSFAAQQAIGENPKIAEHIVLSLYQPDTILDYTQAQEFQADLNALLYLKDSQLDVNGLKSMLEKISLQKPQQLTLLLTTHPPAEERLNKLRRFFRETKGSVAVPIDPTEFNKMKVTLTRLPR
ncbi:MAG: hypothetical protein EHM72_05780 [Calditrichaeota bacterium]|nr:MAG: hypothetical protein EHM72_05780 [Calditrichota bacterium]